MLFSDGYSNNQGGGYVVCDSTGKILDKRHIFRYTTNNHAELLGIQSAATLAEPGDTIITDSQCAMSWIKNGKSKARPDLNPTVAATKQLLVDKQLKLTWQPRDLNAAGHINEFGYLKKPF